MSDEGIEKEIEERAARMFDEGATAIEVYRSLRGLGGPEIDLGKIMEMKCEVRVNHLKKVNELLKEFKGSGNLEGIINKDELSTNPHLLTLGLLFYARRSYKSRYIRKQVGRDVVRELDDLLDIRLVKNTGISPNGKLYAITDLGDRLYISILQAIKYQLGSNEK